MRANPNSVSLNCDENPPYRASLDRARIIDEGVNGGTPHSESLHGLARHRPLPTDRALPAEKVLSRRQMRRLPHQAAIVFWRWARACIHLPPPTTSRAPSAAAT